MIHAQKQKHTQEDFQELICIVNQYSYLLKKTLEAYFLKENDLILNLARFLGWDVLIEKCEFNFTPKVKFLY